MFLKFYFCLNPRGQGTCHLPSAPGFPGEVRGGPGATGPLSSGLMAAGSISLESAILDEIWKRTAFGRSGPYPIFPGFQSP